MDKNLAREKLEKLHHLLQDLPSNLIAFSGGVDSAFLLFTANRAVRGKVIGATASSVIHPFRERLDAARFVRRHGFSHIFFRSEEMMSPEFLANGSDRCYHCKKILFRQLFQIAAYSGLKHVAHGGNLDDLNDFRPGFKAAEEAGAIAPMIDVQLGKEEIRFLSKELGIEPWNKPSMPCIASRIPYGSPVTKKRSK